MCNNKNVLITKTFVFYPILKLTFFLLLISKLECNIVCLIYNTNYV